MILPSEDENRPPWSGDGHGKPEPEDTSFQDAVAWGSEEPDDDMPPFMDLDDDEEMDPSMIHHLHQLGEMGEPAAAGWREELKEELVEAVDNLMSIEDPEADYDPPDPPDMAMLLAGFCALRNDIDQKGWTGNRSLGNVLISLHRLLEGEPKTADVRALVYLLFEAVEFSSFPQTGEFCDPASMIIEGYRPCENDAVPDTVAAVVEPGWSMAGKILTPARVILFRPF